MEATGHAGWFERLMTELGFELGIGDPAQIKAKRVRKQKTDRQDAQLILILLIENRFSKDVGTESAESGSAAITLASASASTGAYANAAQGSAASGMQIRHALDLTRDLVVGSAEREPSIHAAT
jgi:hypothetical protein